jgi:nitrogen fixation/metabolism regulation signal transduction histidine kinase
VWQEIAQRLAHEIKNPLTPIKLSAQRILKKYNHNKDEFDRILVPAITAIIQEVENLDKMLIEFREFARLPLPAPERLNLKSLVKEVAAMYRQLSRRVRVDISGIPEELDVSVDRNQMKQVFANLIKNSIQAMADGGEITLSADIVEKENRAFCRIWIRDTGEGIDELVRENIFHPYFTTKKDGTGLGLAIVERVIFDHNGTIRFETQKNIGTTFIVDLPMEL